MIWEGGILNNQFREQHFSTGRGPEKLDLWLKNNYNTTFMHVKKSNPPLMLVKKNLPSSYFIYIYTQIQLFFIKTVFL